MVKLSWVISDKREAFWSDVRCSLSPVGTNCGALVVFVLLVVHTVLFPAEVGMLKSMDMGDIDMLLWFEFIKVVCYI
jgi:hypothetical protein